MKKQYLKMFLTSLGVVLILAISAFGVASLFAPAAMMDLTASIGLTAISGDYAFQEYERSGDVSCLARSFIVSADLKNDHTAKSRFDTFYALDEFGRFCEEQDGNVDVSELGDYSYRGYVCGLAAKVNYRLANDREEEETVLDFAARETDPSFPSANPLIALAAEAAGRKDVSFCRLLLREMKEGGYTENEDYQAIIKILEGVINE